MTELPGSDGDFVRAGYRENVADAAFLQRGPQLGIASVDLVTRDPCGPVAGVQEPGDHPGGQFRLGGEGGLLGQTRGPAAVGVGGPRAGNIEFPIHRRMPPLSRIDQVDGHPRNREIVNLHAPMISGGLSVPAASLHR